MVNGSIVETTSWLVKPPTGVTAFEPRFIGIHGITPKDVRRFGISWQESLQRIHAIAGDLPFVAHNTSFDKTVYRRASEKVGTVPTAVTWFDTLALSRRYVTAPNHKLPTVAEALKLPKFQHHEAEADAIVSARIAIVISQRQHLHTVQELWGRQRANNAAPKQRPQHITPRFTRVSDLPPPNGDAHPAHPLFGQHVVITGDLDGLSREEFIIKVAKLGGQPQLNVTKKTTMLIVATQEVIGKDYDHTGGTGKEKKAVEYRKAGQEIQIIGAKQALEYLTWSPRKIKRLPTNKKATAAQPSPRAKVAPPRAQRAPKKASSPTPRTSRPAHQLLSKQPKRRSSARTFVDRTAHTENPTTSANSGVAIEKSAKQTKPNLSTKASESQGASPICSELVVEEPDKKSKSAPSPQRSHSSSNTVVEDLGPKQTLDRAVAKSRIKSERRPLVRVPGGLIKAISWTLMILSGLLLTLMFISSTVSLFSTDYPDITFATWLIGLAFLMPLIASPGLLGLFILRRYRKRQRTTVSA